MSRKLSIWKKILFSLSLFILTVVACLLILEMTLRCVMPPTLYTPLMPLYPHVKKKIRPSLRGLSEEAEFTTNKWGLRGDEPPWEWDRYLTVLAVGGSTTICFYLDDKKTWPYRTQEKIKEHHPEVWVGNGGIDGQSTRAHIIFMEEVAPKIKPDVVLVLAGVNDLGFSVSEAYRRFGNPYDEKLNKRWNREWELKLLHSRVVQLAYKWKMILWDKAVVEVDSPHHNYYPKPFEKRPPPFTGDPKRMLPKLGEYRQNLKRIIELGRSMDIQVVLMTQPSLYRDTPYWDGIVGGMYWIRKLKGQVSAATLWKFLDAYNRELMDVCREEEVACLDLAREIPGHFKFFYDVFHFTEAGADLVADKISAFLLEHVPELSGAAESAPAES